MGARRAPKCAKFLQTFQAISKTLRIWPYRFFLPFPLPLPRAHAQSGKTGWFTRLGHYQQAKLLPCNHYSCLPTIPDFPGLYRKYKLCPGVPIFFSKIPDFDQPCNYTALVPGRTEQVARVYRIIQLFII